MCRNSSAKRLQHLPSLKVQATEVFEKALVINETGIMVCNAADGSPSVLLVNNTWTQLTGITSEDACSQTLWELFQLKGGRKNRDIASYSFNPLPPLSIQIH